MATTTPNYGWAVPTSTDLVKDGATAIETLGDAIDASMNTALGTKKAGMVLLSTASFSAVGSVSLPTDTFTATYDNYLWILDFTCSAGVSLSVRMRAAGSDATGADYQRQLYTGDGATSSGARVTAQTSYNYGFASTGRNFSVIEINSPKIARPTLIFAHHNEEGNTANCAMRLCSGGHGLSTAYDSATVLLNANNFTGTYSVYGYNK